MTNSYDIEKRMREVGLSFAALSRRSHVREHRLRLSFDLRPEELAAIDEALVEAKQAVATR